MSTADGQRAPALRNRRRPAAWPNRRGWILGSLAVSLAVNGALLLALPAPANDEPAPVSAILLSLRSPQPPLVESPVVEQLPEQLPEPAMVTTPHHVPASEPAPNAASSVAVPAGVSAALESAPEVAAPAAGQGVAPADTAGGADEMPDATGGDSPGAVVTDTGPVAAPIVPGPLPAPVPSPPAPEPAVDTAALLRQYAGGIKAAVLRSKRYPAQAERLRHEGAVKVGFTVSADGTLSGVIVKDSAGYDELDAAATAAVEGAAPFSAIPAELGRDSLTLSITLDFKLDQ